MKKETIEMRELSLFSGAGGGLLGSKLLGWETIGYVEFNDYCQRVIKQRITDGILDNAPIFGDIRAFNSEGFVESYKGMVDVITGGFPCQPFSIAGKQLGADDPRNMWPETIRTICTIRPIFVFLENVPALLSSGYFGTVIGDLSKSGYDCRWRVLSASELGAPHKRDRVWIVANSRCWTKRQSFRGRDDKGAQDQFTGCSKALSNSEGTNDRQLASESMYGQVQQFGDCPFKTDVSYSNETGLEREVSKGIRSLQQGLFTECSWWSIEPQLGRVANGVANRVDRLKAIGNGQVPAVAATAWKLLTGCEK